MSIFAHSVFLLNILRATSFPSMLFFSKAKTLPLFTLITFVCVVFPQRGQSIAAYEYANCEKSVVGGNSLIVDTSMIQIAPGETRVLLGALVRGRDGVQSLGLTSYLGEHAFILADFAKRKIDVQDYLWAGELRLLGTNLGPVILSANESSGHFARNKIRSNVFALRDFFSARSGNLLRLADNFELHTYDAQHKHLFPMPEQDVSSENFRHDFKNALTIARGQVTLMSYLLDDQAALDSLAQRIHVEASERLLKTLDLMDAFLPAYLSEEASFGIFRLLKAENLEASKALIDRVRRIFLGETPRIDEVAELDSEFGYLVSFLAQTPTDVLVLRGGGLITPLP
jgi:hypothetical protein